MQEVEFEPVEANRTIQHSLKPLSSNTQDYIEELLKTQKSKSQGELYNQMQKFIDKYRQKYVVVEANAQQSAGQKWIAPVDLNKYKITSRYGWRVHPIFGTKKFHDGVDISTPTGTIIKSPADGVVVKSQWNGGYGNYIEIKHTDGTTSFYGHLSKINVQKNQVVKQGQVIGKTGDTGYSAGAHLHWGARDKESRKENPLKIIKYHN